MSNAACAEDTAGDRDRHPLLREVGDQVQEALALLPEQVLGGYADVVEEQLGGVLRVHPELVEVAAALEAVHAALDHDQRDAAVAFGRVGLDRRDHEVGVDAVRDEGLGAVDDVVAVVAARGRGHRREVRPDAGLGHRERRDQRPVGDARQPALPLLVVAVLEEVRHADVVVQRDAEARARDARVSDLLDDDLVEAEVLDAEPAERLGHAHREHALLRGLREQLARHEALGLPLLVVRDDLLGEESPYGFAVVLVLGFEDRALHGSRTLLEYVKQLDLCSG